MGVALASWAASGQCFNQGRSHCQSLWGARLLAGLWAGGLWRTGLGRKLFQQRAVLSGSDSCGVPLSKPSCTCVSPVSHSSKRGNNRHYVQRPFYKRQSFFTCVIHPSLTFKFCPDCDELLCCLSKPLKTVLVLGQVWIKSYCWMTIE